SIENSLSEREDGPTFEGLLERQVKVQLFISARHKNVVMLLGLCTNKSQLMIVYEQVCNDSLEQYLTRGSFQSLTSKQRLKVAIGTARGLKYLHGNNIIHGNIKPSNIILTHDFEPRIGDFDFGKVKHGPKKSSKDNSVRNSGYAAAEYVENGKVSNKTDVYSFGVVLLELIYYYANECRMSLSAMIGLLPLDQKERPLLGGKKYPKLVDLKIRKNSKERITMNMIFSLMLITN
ncbi:Proline-rich receptor-like protein kinase PERK14, partial [Glycine soja]